MRCIPAACARFPLLLPLTAARPPARAPARHAVSAAEVEALRELYSKLSNELHCDSLIHKDELAWALFKAHRDNLFVDRVFELFDIKRNNVSRSLVRLAPPCLRSRHPVPMRAPRPRPAGDRIWRVCEEPVGLSRGRPARGQGQV
jgi:hypothetical protein